MTRHTFFTAFHYGQFHELVKWRVKNSRLVLGNHSLGRTFNCKVLWRTWISMGHGNTRSKDPLAIMISNALTYLIQGF